MAVKKTDELKLRNVANISSIAMIVFLSAAFIIETLVEKIQVDYSIAGLTMIIALVVVIIIQRNSIHKYKMAFNVPFMLFLFYTALMMMCNWYNTHYLFIVTAFTAISCTYSRFNRTLVYIIVTNLILGFLHFRGFPIGGHGTALSALLVNWSISLFSSVIMLLITKTATISLNKALEHQNSFNNLLESTENVVAMIDERNEIVYASKTLAQLGNANDQTLIQGRPLIDLFPGRSLKIHAGKMLKEKDDYSGDWEFTLDGQKRYFKASSHALPGGTGGTLISLYDMTHLAERDEIAAMKDSMKIGLFFMDKNYIIQDHYSRYLEEMLSDTKLFGKLLTDIISDSVSKNEMEAIKDYFNMVLDRSLDLDMLEEINPLNELHYVNKNTGDRKVFQFAFSTVERDRGEIYILVTLYDITLRVELQQRLAEEEARRQEEMQAVFELIQVQPDVFSDFMQDMEHEFETIDKNLKNDTLSTHEALVKVYQSIHAIKSNAVILGLSIFGNKVHNLESKIKKLREAEGDVPFGEMLDLTMDIEKLSNEKEGFREIISKLESYTGGSVGSGSGSDKKQNVKVMIDSLIKTASKAAEDQGKIIQLVTTDVESEAIEKGPRRVMKEILMQLIRNSAVHGVEMPEDRTAKGKNEKGTIKLSIKMSDDKKFINLKLSDDGNGLDFKRIADKALGKNLIRPEDANNQDALTKVIFSPGFSTAETEGVHAGRGIGLNLVRDRLKEVNGTIKIRSEAGKGILFFISIPVVDVKL
ncbi:MAG: ATP-binding protein [Treponema sp.]|nr:ATP-binding protein [Treponema sp.]MCL2236937.1 ATP-binding protein [Treponema sp.]